MTKLLSYINLRDNRVRFFVLALLWGSSYAFIKNGLNYFPPVLFAALSFELAGLLMIPVLVVKEENWIPDTPVDILKIIIGGLFMVAGYHILLFLGQQYTRSVLTSVLISTSPIVTAFASLVFIRERSFTFLEFVGLVISFSGILVLLLGRVSPEEEIEFVGFIGLGPALIFTGVVLFDVGLVIIKKLGPTSSPLRMQAWSMLLAGPVIHLVSYLGFGERLSSAVISWPSVLIILYYVLGPLVMGYMIYFSLLEKMAPYRLNLVSYFTPLVAAGVGFMWLGEVPRISTAGGFVIVLAGYYILQTHEPREVVEEPSFP